MYENSFVQFKTFDADEIKEYGCLMSKKYVRNEYTTDVQLLHFCTDGKIFFTFCIFLHLPVQWERAL